jgi:hypothetical protein
MSELCKLPIGTVFSRHVDEQLPCFNSQLHVLCERSAAENDFYYCPAHGRFENTTHNADVETENERLDSGASVPMGAADVFRWGMYDPDELFVVYDTDDVKKIVLTLCSALLGVEKQKAELSTVTVEVRELPQSDNCYGTLTVVGD